MVKSRVYEVELNLTDLVLHDLSDKLNPDLRSIENFAGKEHKRKFYTMSSEDAYSLLECIAKISGTDGRPKKIAPEGHEIMDEEIAVEVAKEDALNLVNMIFHLRIYSIC